MFKSLRSISDQKILSNTDSIVAEDRKLTLRLLVHLHEIERRKLYLKRGYSSMFVYCTSHLRLSEPAAARRIRTSRALARFPELYSLLESGEVNLSTVSLVAKFLKPENANPVLMRIRGKSRREVERVVAELDPRAVLPPDRVRTVVVPVTPTHKATPPQFTVAGDSEKAPNVESRDSVNDEPDIDAVAPHVEHRALIQFTAGEDFLVLLEQVRSMASHRLPPNASFEQVFALVMSHYVASQDPKARHERRENRKENAKPASNATKSPRQIPARVRDQVFTRDDGRCTYVSSSGKRCDSERLLQIDHIRPVARGGAATVDNLRLLCAQHNRLEAKRLGLAYQT